MSADVRLVLGDVREVLPTLPSDSVNCCVTSPPYWGLRDYGMAGQLGNEATPQGYVAAMVGIFREVRRVLKPDGTLWLNLGDSYASGESGRHDGATTGADRTLRSLAADQGARRDRRLKQTTALPAKSLIGIPWRVALALQDDGWILRTDIIWAKPNPMPESVTDRPTRAHEYIFLFTKSARYWYDADAIREPLANHRPQAPAERNARSVWSVASQPYAGAHFAVFPEAIPTRCIRTGCPPGGVVLDPFAGSGTTLAVAKREGRDAIGIELNPAYLPLLRQRLALEQEPLPW